jgi:hypothetical protein
MSKYILGVALLVLTAACGTTNTAARTGVTSELNALRVANEELRIQLEESRAGAGESRSEGREDPPAVRPRAARPVPVPVRGPHPGFYGPMNVPQNVAWLTRPRGCNRALSMRFKNDTSFYMRVLLDGRELAVQGGAGTLPHIPPGASAYVCLNRTGHHSVAAVAYAGRYGRLTEVSRYQSEFTLSGLERMTNEVVFNKANLRWWRAP